VLSGFDRILFRGTLRAISYVTHERPRISGTPLGQSRHRL
jgi:hypothetical protein